MSARFLTNDTLTSVTSKGDEEMRAAIISGIERGTIEVNPKVSGRNPEMGVRHLAISMADEEHEYIIEVISVAIVSPGIGVGIESNRLYVDGCRLGGNSFAIPVLNAIRERENVPLWWMPYLHG